MAFKHFFENIRDIKRVFSPGKFKPHLYDHHYADKAQEHALKSYSINELKWVISQGYKPKNILDVGCNTARPLDFLCAQWQSSGTGVDINNSAIKRATEDFPQYSFKIYDGLTLPFNNETFDHVMLHHVIGHVDHPETLLNNIWKILKPQGTLSVITPNAYYKLMQFPFNLIKGFLPDITVLRYYSKKSLIDELVNCKFEISAFSYMGAMPQVNLHIDACRLRLMCLAKKPTSLTVNYVNDEND